MIRIINFIILISIFSGCTQRPEESVNVKTNSKITEVDLMNHIKYLADDKRAGRYPGTVGSKEAVDYIVDHFRHYGLSPAGSNGYLQNFDFITGINLGEKNNFTADGERYQVNTDFIPLEFSANQKLKADIVFAGYGFAIDDSIKWNDYNNIKAEGKWVIILRGGPGGDHPHSEFVGHLPLRKKALLARDQKAAGIIFVNQAGDDELIALKHSPNSTAVGIPVIHISRNLADKILSGKLEDLQNAMDEKLAPQSFGVEKQISAEVDLAKETVSVPNVIGLIPGSDTVLKDEYIVIGAHFDHLGFGGEGTGSLTPDANAIHNGADDNASGTAGVLELAEKLSANRSILKRSVVFMAYNAEEEGLLGSKYFVNNPTIDLSNISIMINMDMIGRMSDGKVTVGGTGTSPNFESILNEENKDHGLNLKMSKEGYGPSDHASFYVNDIPVLFFFTGTHNDYHKPSDDWQLINVAGEKQIVELIYDVVVRFGRMDNRPTFTEAGPKEARQTRRSFKVTFGVIPSYGSNAEGLEIDGAKKDGPAGKAGLQKGDIIISIDGKPVKNIYDYMYRLAELKPGRAVDVIIKRGEEELTIKVNL